MRFIAVIAGFLIAGAASSQAQPKVVASTGWTAAFARAAGATDVTVIAPYDMRHPPEYELKPSDVAKAGNADFIIYAGYERMVKKLAEATENRKVRLVKIETRNDLPTIEASVRAAAGEFGTAEKAERNLAAIREFFEAWKAELKAAGFYGAPALVHFHQVPLVKYLGFDVRGVFGPGPLEAAQIVALAKAETRLIVDNRHNEIAKPLAEIRKDAKVASLFNFPNSAKTPDLLDLLAVDKKYLDEALGK